jgi:hypothetical protein
LKKGYAVSDGTQGPVSIVQCREGTVRVYTLTDLVTDIDSPRRPKKRMRSGVSVPLPRIGFRNTPGRAPVSLILYLNKRSMEMAKRYVGIDLAKRTMEVCIVQGKESERQNDYTKQAGSDEAETGLNFFQDVGRQMTATVLNGARIVRRGVGSNGTYYVLVSYSESAVRKVGSDAIQTAAAKAQINAEKALRSMDAGLSAERTPELVETGGE